MKNDYLDYQIMLDEKTLESLNYDLQIFNINNLNLLFNMIIVSYYETFLKKEQIIHDKLSLLLNSHKIDILLKEKLLNEMLKTLITFEDTKDQKTIKKKLHVKESNLYEFQSFLALTELLLGNTISISTILRMLFVSFSKKTRTEKEFILFKNIIDKVEEASKENIILKVKLQNQKEVNINPYGVFDPFDHDALFLVGELPDQKLRTIRISQIKMAFITYQNGHITPLLYQDFIEIKKAKFDLGNLASLINLDSDNILPEIKRLKQLTHRLI